MFVAPSDGKRNMSDSSACDSNPSMRAIMAVIRKADRREDRPSSAASVADADVAGIDAASAEEEEGGESPNRSSLPPPSRAAMEQTHLGELGCDPPQPD
jgi:hypothetical protein